MPPGVLQRFTEAVALSMHSRLLMGLDPQAPLKHFASHLFIPDNNRVIMPRPQNSSQGDRFEVTLSVQSVKILKELAMRGVYGRTPAEVGGRFIEQALHQFVEQPRFSV